MRWLVILLAVLVSQAHAFSGGFPGRMGPVATGNSDGFVSPSSYTGLLAWYDISSASTVIKDGSNLVSSVSDTSGNAYNLSSTGTLRPTYIADDGDGLATVSMTLGTQLKNTTNTTTAEETFFAVIKYPGVASSISGSGGQFPSRGSGAMVVSSTANSLGWTTAGSTDGTTGLRNAPDAISGTYFILSGVRSSATDLYFGGTGNIGTIELWENGAYLKRTTHTGGSIATALFVGRDNSNNAAAMSLREYILYGRALTKTQRLNVENYLNNKWHVYNNFAGRRNFNDGLQRYFTLTSTTSPTAAYPLVVISGQSNALGEAQISLTSLPAGVQGAIPGALIYSPTVAGDWATLQVGVNNQPNSARSATFVKHGLELSLGYDLAHDISSPTYILKNGQGGTSLATRWLPSLVKTNNLWRTREDTVELARYNAGLTGINLPILADIWYQGEQDATDGGSSVTNYGANEQTMIANTRTFRGFSNRVISVKVRDVTEPSANYDAVSNAKISNTSIITGYQVTEGWDTQSPVGGPHGDSTSMLKIGNTTGGLLGTTTHIP